MSIENKYTLQHVQPELQDTFLSASYEDLHTLAEIIRSEIGLRSWEETDAVAAFLHKLSRQNEVVAIVFTKNLQPKHTKTHNFYILLKNASTSASVIYHKFEAVQKALVQVKNPAEVHLKLVLPTEYQTVEQFHILLTRPHSTNSTQKLYASFTVPNKSRYNNFLMSSK